MDLSPATQTFAPRCSGRMPKPQGPSPPRTCSRGRRPRSPQTGIIDLGYNTEQSPRPIKHSPSSAEHSPGRFPSEPQSFPPPEADRQTPVGSFPEEADVGGVRLASSDGGHCSLRVRGPSSPARLGMTARADDSMPTRRTRGMTLPGRQRSRGVCMPNQCGCLRGAGQSDQTAKAQAARQRSLAKAP